MDLKDDEVTAIHIRNKDTGNSGIVSTGAGVRVRRDKLNSPFIVTVFDFACGRSLFRFQISN